MRTILGICLTVLACCVAYAQPKNGSPTFEVASVKPAPPSTPAIRNHVNTGGPGTPNPGRVDWWSVSMLGFLMEAFDVKPNQISGPDWLVSTKFDVTATVPKGATKEQYRLMLQNLLAERFKAKTHFEKKESTVYSLVVAKNGLKMKKSVEEPAANEETGSATPPPPAKAEKDPDGFPVYPNTRGVYNVTANGRTRMRGHQVTMERLIATLTNHLGYPIKDETQLEGKYDFVLTYSPAGTPDGSTGTVSDPDPDLIGALQQIGLKLEQKKGMIDILVIDHLEKVPTEN
jgi:uncharacterized protein (TIGR03435 family)